MNTPRPSPILVYLLLCLIGAAVAGILAALFAALTRWPIPPCTAIAALAGLLFTAFFVLPFISTHR